MNIKKITETDRLILRRSCMEDDRALLEIITDGGMPHLAQFGPLDITYAQAFINRILKSYKENGFGLWAIVEKESNSLIGYCGVHKITINQTEEVIELAYRIYKKLWGKGFATEAARTVRDYAFYVLNFPEIISCIGHDNERSKNVAEKVGLTYWKDGTFRDIPHRIYRLKRDQLPPQPKYDSKHI